MQKRNILSFEDAEDAMGTLPKLLKSGDLALIKGSRSMQLELLLDEVKVRDSLKKI